MRNSMLLALAKASIAVDSAHVPALAMLSAVVGTVAPSLMVSMIGYLLRLFRISFAASVRRLAWYLPLGFSSCGGTLVLPEVWLREHAVEV